MATDRLILAGIVFENFDYAPPTKMPFGGQQAMVVHKLPGGTRVIDTLGPDEDDITWSGFFFTANALYNCQVLDALRGQGQVVTLTFAGMTRKVVIKHFRAAIRRYPNWVEYEISCVVSENPLLGPVAGGTPFVTPVPGVGTGVELTAGVAGAASAISGPAAIATGALVAADLSTALTAGTTGISSAGGG
jgi:hypothetical protein